MSWIRLEKMKCALCGTVGNYDVILGTSSFGYPDLDLRPPLRARSILYAQIGRCRGCGYCASDVRESTPVAKSVVDSAEYRRQLNDRSNPDLANEFLCKAIIDAATGDHVAAAWATIRAAWACDDDGDFSGSTACRSKAADIVMVAEEQGLDVAEAGANSVLIVDLLRRSNRIDEARTQVAERRVRFRDESTIGRILEFQADLIKVGDVSCHTASDALEENKREENKREDDP